MSLLILYSLPLSQYLCLTLTFVGLFLHLRDGLLASETLTICSVVTIVTLGATMPSTSLNAGDESADKVMQRTTSVPAAGTDENRVGMSNIRPASARVLAQPLSYALLGLVILALSPLLKTLTQATTSDSIAALSTTLFLISFALADFSSNGEGGKGRPEASRKDALGRRRSSSTASLVNEGLTPSVAVSQAPLPATLSLNAALCASIVLASRLESPIDVFSLVLAAIGLFAFAPRWLKHHLSEIGTHRWKRRLVITLLLLLCSTVLLFPFSQAAAVANAGTAAFLSVVCPLWMRKAQTWKLARRGPWDVAVPRLRQ